MVKKRLLLYSIYYWPEVASTAQIYSELCEELVDEWDVTVVCAVPCYTGKIAPEYQIQPVYREEHNGVHIIRVRVPEFDKQDKRSRVRNIYAFWRAARQVTRTEVGPQDLVLTYSQPPILGGMLGVYGARRLQAPFVYGIQDFNPEQTMAVGYAGGPFVHTIMMALDKRSCRKAACVVVPGRDLGETIERRFAGEPVPRYEVINNWADDQTIVPLPKDNPGVMEFRERYGLTGKFVVMYSGNVGLYYDLPNLMRVISEFKNRDDVAFAIVGEGAVLPKLRAFAEENELANVIFIPYQPKEKLVYSLNAADVHLVTNAIGIKGVSCPSKAYGIMATDVPILAILEEGSEVWRLVEESGCGSLAHAGDYAEVRVRLLEILDGGKEWVNAHRSGRTFLEAHLTREKALEKYRELFREVAGGDIR